MCALENVNYNKGQNWAEKKIYLRHNIFIYAFIFYISEQDFAD